MARLAEDNVLRDDDRLSRLTERPPEEKVGVGYSRFVKTMRYALPLIVVAIVGVLWFGQDVHDTIVVDERHVGKNGLGDMMRDARPASSQNELLNPVFESLDKKNRPYRIVAKRAVQGEKNKDLVILDDPVGVMTLGAGDVVNVRAQSGAYRQDTQRFFLEGDVILQHVGGYNLHSQEAHIDLVAHLIWSETAVTGSAPDMTIAASSLRANGKTGHVVFVGPVKLVLVGDSLNVED